MLYLRMLGVGFAITLGMELALGFCFALKAVFGKRGRKK